MGLSDAIPTPLKRSRITSPDDSRPTALVTVPEITREVA